MWDFIKNIGSNISDILNDYLNKNSDSLIPSNKKPNSFFKSASNANTVPNFPKIELLGTKGNQSKGLKNQLTINDYQKKYAIESLQQKIPSMSNQEKAYVYYFLAFKHNKLRGMLGSKIEETKIAIKYLDKALEFYPDNIDFAYEYFRICFQDDLCFCRDNVIDICERCIDLSNNQDIKNEFSNIYLLMGKYYYLELEEYSKALDCFNKALEYSKNQPQDIVLSIYRYLIILNDTIGNFNEALQLCNITKKIKPNYFDIGELRSKILNKIKAGVTVERINQKKYRSDMNYSFKNSIGKYPEKHVQEAYEHYLNAQKLIQNGKRSEAIKEYQLVKKMLPEETQQINDLISMHISIGLALEAKGMDKDLLFDCLYENMQIYSAAGNQKELARIYDSLGCAYSNIEDYDKAVEFHQKSLSLIENPFHYSNLAICYTSMGKYHEAIEIYEIIKKKYPQVEKDIKPDYQIERLKGIISGKINPREKIDNNKILADEQSKKGDLKFDKQNYVDAIKNYNAAFGIKDEAEYIFKVLLCNNIYEYTYYDESEKGFEAVNLCAQKDNFKYLPFLCTVYGDALSYEAWGQGKLSAEYYEMAVFLLDMVPVKERFAAPYYKLALIKEQSSNYKEALKLFEQTKEIDKYYNVEDDIVRIQNILDKKEEINKKEFTNHYELVKKYQKAKIYNMFFEEGKKALQYSPNNVELYYLIANTAIKQTMLFEAKWAAKEGLRLDLEKDNEADYFYKFILILGKCCKYENKLEQAKNYFGIILDNEEDTFVDYYKEAQTESYYIDSNFTI